MVAEATVLAVVAVFLGGVVYVGTQILRRINQVMSTVDRLQSDAAAHADVLTAVATAQREDGGHLAQLRQDLTVIAAHVSDVKAALAALQPVTKEQLDAELAVRLGRLADERQETTAAIASLRERGPRFDSPVTRLTFQESLDLDRFAEASSTSATTSLTRLLVDHTADGIVVAVQSVRLTQQGAEMIVSASAAGRQLLREGRAVIPFHSVTGARLPLLTDVRTGKIIEHLKEMPVSAVTSKLASISSMVVGAAHLVAGADLAKRLSRLESKLDFLLAARRIDQFATLERVYVSARELLQEKATYISGRYLDISVEPVVQALSAVVTPYREMLPNSVALDQDVLDVEPSA